MKILSSTKEYSNYQNKVVSAISNWSPQSSCLKKSVDEDFFDTRESALNYLSKKYCYKCPVRQHCLYTSMVTQETYGLWGGLTPKQRRYFISQVLHIAKQNGISVAFWSKELDDVYRQYSDPEKVFKIFA